MNIDELRQRLLGAIDELIESRDRSVANLRFRPTAVVDGAIMPGNTAEELALMVTEFNAERRTLHGVRQVINDEINKLLSPKQEQPKEDKPMEGMY